MKPKKANYNLLNQDIKKRKQKMKNNSIPSQSQLNDDSLDNIQRGELNTNKKTNHTLFSTKNNLLTKKTEQIDEQDLVKLRSCITDQFKKTNFINLSVIKKENNLMLTQAYENSIDKTYDNNLKETNISLFQQNCRKKLFITHNRSQSCPFIQPIYIYDNVSTKDGKNDPPSVVSSSMKIEKQPKKKISIQHFTRNRNKFNMGGSAQKKNLTHNYSNSLTQSSNTVIVHNIPNQIAHHIAPNQNLSNILYKKVQQEQQQAKDKKQKPKQQSAKVQTKQLKSKQKMKKSQLSQKKLHKKSLAQMKLRNDIVIKTKIQHRIRKYQNKQSRVQIQNDSSKIKIKQKFMQRILNTFIKEDKQSDGQYQKQAECLTKNKKCKHKQIYFNFNSKYKMYQEQQQYEQQGSS